MQRLAAVIDDNANARLTAGRTLTKSGYQVSQFPTAPEFLAQWSPGSVDLIVSDWHLSQNDRGDELFDHLRKQDWEVPLILISGQLGDREQRLDVLTRLLDSGNTRFVQRGSNAFARIKILADELQSKRNKVLLHLIRNHRLTKDHQVPVSGGGNAPSAVDKILADYSYSSEYTEELLNDLFSDILNGAAE